MTEEEKLLNINTIMLQLIFPLWVCTFYKIYLLTHWTHLVIFKSNKEFSIIFLLFINLCIKCTGTYSGLNIFLFPFLLWFFPNSKYIFWFNHNQWSWNTNLVLLDNLAGGLKWCCFVLSILSAMWNVTENRLTVWQHVCTVTSHIQW